MQPTYFDSPEAQDRTTEESAGPQRIFLYDGQVFEDPGPDYSIQDVLEALAQTYPALANGTWTSRSLPDGSQEITFVKVTGEKGNQTDFFDPAEGPPLLPGPTAPKRVFLYDGQIFEDPGPQYSVQDILNFLAQTYPALANGTWTSRSLPDGSEEITFVKVTGEKGATLEAGQLAACLAELDPPELAALALVSRLMASQQAGQLEAATLLELAPEIEAALDEIERVSKTSRRILTQCLTLQPMPHPKIPLGF